MDGAFREKKTDVTGAILNGDTLDAVKVVQGLQGAWLIDPSAVYLHGWFLWRNGRGSFVRGFIVPGGAATLAAPR